MDIFEQIIAGLAVAAIVGVFTLGIKARGRKKAKRKPDTVHEHVDPRQSRWDRETKARMRSVMDSGVRRLEEIADAIEVDGHFDRRPLDAFKLARAGFIASAVPMIRFNENRLLERTEEWFKDSLTILETHVKNQNPALVVVVDELRQVGAALVVNDIRRLHANGRALLSEANKVWW